MLTQYTRNKDFSDDQANNVGGRSTVDCTGLDSELDEVKTVLDEVRTYFSLLLRDDLTQIISSEAITYISAALNTNSVFIWRGAWVTSTAYILNNMVSVGFSSYICIVAHTSGVFATDLAAGKWEILAQGSANLPAQSGATINKVLMSNGVAGTETWTEITTTQAPTLAPKANPAITGVMTVEAIQSGIQADAPAAGVITHDFNTKFLHTVTISGNITGWNTSNRGNGKMIDVKVTASGGPHTIVFNANWKFVGVKPSAIAAGKTAMLSIRCFGTTEADIIASWSVET